MVIEKRNNNRFSERFRTWVYSVIQTMAETLGSLFDLREEDTLRKKGMKTGGWVISRAIYFAADHSINALQVALAVSVKALGFSFPVLFATLWVFDFIAAGSFVVIYEVTGKDLTTGADARRAVDTLWRRSKILGILTWAGNILLSLAWIGPESVLAYYRKELHTRRRLIVALLVFTGVQAFLWAALYNYAYEFVVQYL